MKEYSLADHLSADVKKAIKTLSLEQRRKCKIMAECGIRLTLQDVEHIRTLTNETQLENFCRKLLFPC